ncbi:MAG TPA: hypothetical protein VFO35_15780 [Steroidobacteraceae bacterium]|nr:hypothetical protein [Steroidobacteraceae bacterium]
MRTHSGLIAITALLATSAQAQTPNCQSVDFSDSVVQRFPHVREACLDVIQRQGELLAVFKADLLKVTGNKVRIRAKLPDGSHAPAQTVQISPQRRVLVNGKSLRADQLALGQELTIYAKVNEPVATVAPAEVSEPVEFWPLENEPARLAAADPQMPHTASLLPAIGLGGVLLLGVGAVLGALRRAWNRT